MTACGDASGQGDAGATAHEQSGRPWPGHPETRHPAR